PPTMPADGSAAQGSVLQPPLTSGHPRVVRIRQNPGHDSELVGVRVMSSRWARFHEHYDDPESGFSERLEVTRTMLGEVLDAAEAGAVSLLDMCAGEGRVVLPVIASHPRGADVRAHLVDSDPEVCAKARETVDALGLEHVEVIDADAGRSSTYA